MEELHSFRIASKIAALLQADPAALVAAGKLANLTDGAVFDLFIVGEVARKAANAGIEGRILDLQEEIAKLKIEAMEAQTSAKEKEVELRMQLVEAKKKEVDLSVRIAELESSANE